ncbi:hypothetical protein ACFKA9_003857 [Vibrio parahaemolyticus]
MFSQKKITASLIEEYLNRYLCTKTSEEDGELIAYYSDGIESLLGFEILYVPFENTSNANEFLSLCVKSFIDCGMDRTLSFNIQDRNVKFVSIPPERYINSFIKDKERHKDSCIGYFQVVLN